VTLLFVTVMLRVSPRLPFAAGVEQAQKQPEGVKSAGTVCDLNRSLHHS